MPGPALGTGNTEINEVRGDSEQSYDLSILGHTIYTWHSQNASLGQDSELKEGGIKVAKSDFLVTSYMEPIGTKSLEPKGTR